MSGASHFRKQGPFEGLLKDSTGDKLAGAIVCMFEKQKLCYPVFGPPKCWLQTSFRVAG